MNLKRPQPLPQQPHDCNSMIVSMIVMQQQQLCCALLRNISSRQLA
jgi:hypothetical protein